MNSDVEIGSRSLQRGLAVLECICRHDESGIRISQLVRECGLERTTVYRLLSTLIAIGYVGQRGRFHYVAGAGVGRLMNRPTNDIAANLVPVLRSVSQITEDASFAIVREGTQSHCIARHIGTFPVQVLSVQVGRRQPLGVGAAGLALLSALPPHEAGQIIASNAAALRAYGQMTPNRLQGLINATRERGWSVVGNHVVDNVLGVGVVVRSRKGSPIAAISVAAPEARMSMQRQAFIVKVIRENLASQLRNGL